jgi:hypothetical protein
MTQNESRLSEPMSQRQRDSIVAPYPDFRALEDDPAYLGGKAHIRLEEIFGRPVASDDRQPQADAASERRSGVPMGDIVGREKEFRQNIPQIEANIERFAEEQGISIAQAWSEVIDVLQGSGIGREMYRTLDRPVGGQYGAIGHVNENGQNGIGVIFRENIYNWGGRRNDHGLAFLGSLPLETRQKIEMIIYAGTGRQYKGANELWSAEVQPYVQENEEGNKVSDLTEARMAEEIRAPKTDELFGRLGLREQVSVVPVIIEDPKASGDEVVRKIIEARGEQLRNLLIIESGNAPAGYTQLMAALILARELDVDPAEQYLGISDGVQIVQPDFYNALPEDKRSKVQNGQTALNSFNGWLRAIGATNQYFVER